MAFGLTSAAYGTNSIAQGLYADAYGEGAIAFGHETVSGAHVQIKQNANLKDVHTAEFTVSGAGVTDRTLADGSVAGLDKNNTYTLDGNVKVSFTGAILSVAGEAFGYDKNNIKLASTDATVTRDEETGYYYYTKDGKQQQVGINENLIFTGTGGKTVTVAAGKMTLSSGGISVGSYAHAEGDKALAVGRVAGAYGRDSAAIGRFANAIGEDGLAIGHNTSAGAEVDPDTLDKDTNDTGNIVTGDNSIAVGKGHTVSGKNSGAFGDPDNVYADASFAIGNDNTIGDKDDSTKGINTFVVGNNVTTTEEGTVVVGHHTAPVAEEGSEPQSSFSFGKNSISLGTDAVASVENTVALGSTSVAKR